MAYLEFFLWIYASNCQKPCCTCIVWLFRQAAVICNNAQIVEGMLQGQPTEGALLACAMKVYTSCSST